MTPEDVDTIEARANAATEGHWEYFGDYIVAATMPVAQTRGWGQLTGTVEAVRAQMTANGDFIAAARADVPALVAEVRRLRALLKEVLP